MRSYRRTKLIGLVSFLILIGLGAFVAAHIATTTKGDDRGVLADLISRAISTPAAQISIGDVSGVLSSDVTIRNVSIADQDGVWLQLDSLKLAWSRTALLLGKLEIDRLDVGRLAILRKPLPSPQPTEQDSALLPELPVKVELKSFALAELALGASLLGTEVRLSASGQAMLGNPAEGLNLKIAARRLDTEGQFAVKLDYMPASDRLQTALTLNEAPGGILVRLLKIAGLPAAKLDLHGDGTLDAFDARLAFDAGSGTGADGSAHIVKQQDGRRLTLDLAARIQGLLPSIAQPVFADTTRLNGSIRFAGDGGIFVEPLSVVSTLARMDVAGSFTGSEGADLTIRMRAIPNAGDTTSVNEIGIKQLALDATVNGPLSGPKIAATVMLRDAKMAQGKFGRIDASFRASPAGSLLDKATTIDLAAQVTASGLEASDAAVNSAVGSSFAASLTGTSRSGVIDIQSLQLKTDTATASFSGQVGSLLVKGRAKINATDLSRFGALAGLKLQGVLALDADVDGNPDTGHIDAKLGGGLKGLATGLPQIDNLAGGAIDITGLVRMLPDNGFGFSKLRLAGRHATARLDGDATTQKAKIKASLLIPQLSYADATLRGRAEMDAQLSGSLGRPNANVSVVVTDAQASGRPVQRLELDIVATDVTGALDAKATLTGTVDRNAANGHVIVAKRSDGSWRLGDLDLRIGSFAANGAVVLDQANILSGQLTVGAANLDDLSPIALAKMAGAFDANLNFNADAGAQNAQIDMHGRNLKYARDSVGKVNVSVALRDIWQRPMADGEIAIDAAPVAGEAFSSFRIVSRSAPSGSDITLKLNGRRIAADARATLAVATNIKVKLATLTARYDKSRVSLARPATFTLRDHAVDIRDVALSLDSGLLTVTGTAGETLDLKVSARAVPLAIANAVAPDLALAGTLDAQAHVTGPAQAPTGDWRVSIDRLAAAQTREFALPAITVHASGRLANGQTTLDSQVSAPRAGQLRASGSILLKQADLNVALKGWIDLTAANGKLSPQGRHVSGRAELDLRVAGSLDKPRINGVATLAGGTFDDTELGIKLTGIGARLVARGEDLTIAHFAARLPNGGELSARGRISLDVDAGLPGAIEVSGRDVLVASNGVMKMRASPRLRVSGALMRDPGLVGRIDIDGLEINIPERLPATLRPLAGTRHVGAPQHVQRVLDEEKKKTRPEEACCLVRCCA